MDYEKPVVKWVGGKTQIIDTIISKFPSRIKNYYEPFVGGGSVLFAFLTEVKNGHIQVLGKICASDKNRNLINVYKNIQRYPNQLIKKLRRLKNVYNSCADNGQVYRNPHNYEEALTSKESYYYWTRKKYNTKSDDTIKTSAMFIFLNKTCFRGLYREGPNGFNAPFGHYSNPSIFSEQHILAVSKLIKNVRFTTKDFTSVLSKRIQKKDFIYLDPPYVPEKVDSFVSYTANGFDIDDHLLLFKLIKNLANNGVSFLLSNANVRLVRDVFKKYKVKVLTCKRVIHSKNPLALTKEVLVYN